MVMRLNFRNFTGKTICLDIDPDQTISEIRGLIAASGKGKSVRVPALVFKGHELRDWRQLSYYDLTDGATVHIS